LSNMKRLGCTLCVINRLWMHGGLVTCNKFYNI
jgi:hypothetical protein